MKVRCQRNATPIYNRRIRLISVYAREKRIELFKTGTDIPFVLNIGIFEQA